MKENAVDLLISAMAKNFYIYIRRELTAKGVPGIDEKCRIKRFIRDFLAVPAKWIATGRQHYLKIYSNLPYDYYFRL